MQFVRAPDENVFIAPFNLIEIVFLSLPFEWWMSKAQYEKLNDSVMGVIYAPLLLVTAFLETRTARMVKFNRSRNESDDDTIEVWEQMGGDLDVEGSGWGKRVEESCPNVVEDKAVVEVRKLQEEMKELKEMVKLLLAKGDVPANGGGN
ncbi:Calcium channel yvc1 [Elasticomyces elasticus]